MTYPLKLTSSLALIVALAVGCAATTSSHSPRLVDTAPAATHDGLTSLPYTLNVRSTTLAPGATMPAVSVFNGFGCTGDNVSPALSWSAGPPETRSYLVMLHDPDAPTGVGFHHWWVANVPASTTALPEGFGTRTEGPLASQVVQGRTDYGAAGYGGPCPPKGRTHRYEFYVWALSAESLGVDASTSAAVVRFMVRTQALAAGRLVATYGR
jgi:Raf kinase inhibitor-like YbhB/YbcL family protein